MTKITGTVTDTSTKDVSTKFGTKATYSIKVDSQWIKCGFKDPKVVVGEQVECDAETGTYGMETKKVISLGKSSTVVPSTPVRTGSGYSGSSRPFPIPPLHGDRSIVRQNALSRAVELYVAAQGGKTFALDVELQTKLVIHIARKFEAYTTGDIDLEEAEAEIATKAA